MTLNKFLAGKLSDWIYRVLLMAALAAIAFLQDTAKRSDVVALRGDIAALASKIIDLDKRLAVNEALRVKRDKTGE